MTKKLQLAAFQARTIGQQIECLARLTGAPKSFVCQVRNLFCGKGIGLDSDALPYVAALEEAFTREECIRGTTGRAQRNLAQARRNFKGIGEPFTSFAQAPHYQAPRARRTREVIVDGDHRSLVLPRQLDQMPMVPGPEEQQ
jgi:hypothetical protein